MGISLAVGAFVLDIPKPFNYKFDQKVTNAAKTWRYHAFFRTCVVLKSNLIKTIWGQSHTSWKGPDKSAWDTQEHTRVTVSNDH